MPAAVTPRSRKVLKVPKNLQHDIESNEPTTKVKKKPPNIIIKLKNERFLISQNKIELINNNNKNESSDDASNNNEEDHKSKNHDSSSEYLTIDCDKNIHYGDPTEKEAFKLLQDYLDKTPEMYSLLASHGLLESLHICREEEETIEFDFQLSDLPINTRIEALELEVFNNLAVFDRVDEIEAAMNEEYCKEVTVKSSKPGDQRKAHPGVKVLYDCKTCDKVFMTWHDLITHETVHDAVLSCDICEKTFRKKSYFETHKDIHKCSICGQMEKLNSRQVCVKCDDEQGSQSRSNRRSVRDSSRWRSREALSKKRVMLKIRYF